MGGDAWTNFADILTTEMTRAGISSRELAERLADHNVTEESVSNWRRKRSRPPLELLSAIVNAINEERRPPESGESQFSLLILLQGMNVIPASVPDRELFDSAHRLLKLQLKEQDATDAISRLGRRDGAARVVQAAVGSRKWAVAVWPSYEGPPDVKLHVGDRIDIRRIAHEDDNLDDAVWADPDMKAALRGTNALPSTVGPRWPDGAPGDTSKWSISHVTSPREPVVSTRWPGLRGLALVATTRKSWVNEVAALVAIGLGYGLITTPQLAMTASGRRPPEIPVREQYWAHDYLLQKPPHRRVWSHWGVPLDNRPDLFGSGRSDVEIPRFVFLDESDGLLEENEREGLATVEELAAARLKLRTAFLEFPRRDHIKRLETELHLTDRTARWEQVFSHAFSVLTWLSGPGMVTFPSRAVREIHAHSAHKDPGVAAPFLDWLKAKGWPASDQG